MWNPAWRSDADHVATANGWKLIEQADGRLAFQTQDGTTTSPIIFTGNEADVAAAISRAAGALKLRLGLQVTTARLTAAVPIAAAIVNGKKMTKLQAFAERLPALKAALDKDGDDMNAMVDEIERMRPEAKAAATTYVASQKADLQNITDTLRQLTNLPLGDSDGSQGG